MIFKARNYFIGTVVASVIIMCIWTYITEYSPLQPATRIASHLKLKSVWDADSRQATYDSMEQHLTGLLSGRSETEHEGILIKEEIEGGDNMTEDDPDNDDDDVDDIQKDYFEIDDLDEEQEELGKFSNGTEALDIGVSPDMGKQLERELPSQPLEKYGKAKPETNGERYLIYMCDEKVRCSGFADRQRAIVGIYLMALATNRTYGAIMTEPAPLTDFYGPNKVEWDINPSDFVGKSTIDLDCYTIGNKCNFKDVNAFYPDDVIYIRSKDDFFHILGKLGNYRQNIPKWALGSRILTFGHAWVTLMKPTRVLRDDVNSLLLEIAKDMHQDEKIIPKIHTTDICVHVCEKIMNEQKVQNQSIAACLDVLDGLDNLEHSERISYLRHICPVKKAITPPPLDTIKAATGYDYVELELVCAQVRLGRSTTIRGEPIINKIEDVVHIWDVLRPYINEGHHVFLASDSQEVRDQAKEQFGPRAHVNSEPIIHINKVRKQDDSWQGMKTALGEQLFISTSCKILIFTSSGFGIKAANVRHFLTKGRNDFKTYIFDNGSVRVKDFDHKPPLLPVRKP